MEAPTVRVDVGSIPAIGRSGSRELASTEHGRLVDLLRSLDRDDWSLQTDCPLWDVRAMAGHSVGALGDFTSYRSLLRRMLAVTRASKRNGVPMVDAMTAMQVADHAALSTDELVDLAARNGPRAARWRAGANPLFRRMPMKQEFDGHVETWRMGYLLDVILTRDPWMHRVDITRATGRDLVLTAEHDGRIVAGVVAEWAGRHGRPFELTLTGPAGGRYGAGGGSGDEVVIDAVEFCRTLSGRAPGTGLLAQPVPF